MAFTIQVISRPQRTRLFRDPLGIDNECISVFVPCRQYFWKCGLPNCSLTQFFLCQPSCYTWAKVILKISGNMTEKREKWVHAPPKENYCNANRRSPSENSLQIYRFSVDILDTSSAAIASSIFGDSVPRWQMKKRLKAREKWFY